MKISFRGWIVVVAIMLLILIIGSIIGCMK